MGDDERERDVFGRDDRDHDEVGRDDDGDRIEEREAVDERPTEDADESFVPPPPPDPDLGYEGTIEGL